MTPPPAPVPGCPTPAELAAFHGGELPESAADRVADHLAGCPACEAALDALDEREGSLVAGLRRSPSEGGDGAGTVIAGRYTLVGVLGEGGMGTVWRAVQTAPVRRAVAVKLVKAGMDSRAVLARFEAERQALALMDHPNIARVLDAGATERGRPYFAMELVEGAPITAYCDAKRLTPAARLELFVPVCRAVQHAHQKGIIHRDLKPSNVLVAEVDGRPVPKVIDFGVAKAIESGGLGLTLQTAAGGVVGTPEYMAPEQAGHDGLWASDVDTRADVYALGVLLYELLTGTTPLTRQRAHKAAVAEILRLVREEEPPAPSSRLSTAAGRASVAANRGTEPARLSALMRGELDWVVLKCLEKDRQRRYDSAAALAREVERYLADEPVESGRPSRRYRLRKFARRYRRPLGAAALAALLLAAAAGVSIWQAVEATEARRTAERERDEKRDALARVELEQAKTAAALAASERETAAQKTTAEFFSKFFLQAARPKGAENGLGKDVTLRRVIDAAVAALDTAFPGRPDVEAALRHKLAESYNFMDDGPTALKHYQRTLALWQQAGRAADDPDVLQTKSDIAVVHHNAKRYAEALKLYEEVLAGRTRAFGPESERVAHTLNNISVVYYFQARYPDAVRVQEEALRLRRAALGDEHNETLRSLNNLASMYLKVGRTGDGARLFEELAAARRRLDRDPATASPLNTHMVLSNLGQLYLGLGRPADAVRVLEEVVPLERANLEPDHVQFLDTLKRLTDAYLQAGRPGDCRRACEELVPACRRKCGPADPRTLGALHTAAQAEWATGRAAGAERLFAAEATGWRQHFRAAPAALAGKLAAIGQLLLDFRRPCAAEPYLRESLALRQSAEPDPSAVAEVRSLLGDCLRRQKRYAEAEPLLLAGHAGAATDAAGAAAERLVALYAAWGKAAELPQWRGARAAAPAESAPPPRALR